MDETNESGQWPEVMFAQEVASLLRCDRKTVYEAVAQGQLPHVRVGRSLRFYRDAILMWLGGDVNVLAPRSPAP